MKPVFIFSLPRSGSTLLQRMLCTSDNISSASEPWILLPFIYTLKPNGVIAEYSHGLMFRAVSDFYKGFPNDKNDYLEALREFAMNLYSKRMRPGSEYFLDKTPRYHLICNEIIDLFPEGKYIFLWRNPLAVVSSIIKSWTKGKWKISYYKIDLYDGLSNLIETFERRAPKILSVQFETLLRNPDSEMNRICEYLDIDYDDRMISSFSQVQFDGWMGDRIGSKKYSRLHCSTIDTWKKTFDNPYRRYWAAKYLKWIGSRRLSLMGYNRKEIEYSLKQSNCLNVKSMLYDLTTAFIHNVIGPTALYRYTKKTSGGIHTTGGRT